MPTVVEWAELIENCTWTWTTQNNIDGYLVISNTNGNSIFLPAAGDKRSTHLVGAGSLGEYWSSSLDTGSSDHLNRPDRACRVYFYNEASWYYSERHEGYSVRPVCE